MILPSHALIEGTISLKGTGSLALRASQSTNQPSREQDLFDCLCITGLTAPFGSYVSAAVSIVAFTGDKCAIVDHTMCDNYRSFGYQGIGG